MTRNPLKLLAFTGAVALGMMANSNVHAENIVASLITSSAITVTAGDEMDFGTWLLQLTAAEIADDGITLTMANDGSVTPGDNDNSSQLVEITSGLTHGTVLVQTPAPASLTMTRTDGATTNGFNDGDMTLTTVNWWTTGAPASIADAATATVVTTIADTDLTVNFIGLITVEDTPSDATHTHTFDISFAY